VKRRLFTLAAAASLMLCVATVTLWVRSIFFHDSIRPSRWDVFTLPHCCVFVHFPHPTPQGWEAGWNMESARTGDARDLVPRVYIDENQTTVTLPFWLPLLVGTAVLISSLHAWRKGRAGRGFPIGGQG
jgi:hypothetical protein